MKICVVSDSHGEVENLQDVIDSSDFDILIHLGDDYIDMDNVSIPQEFIRVPGVYDDEYFQNNIEKRILKKFGYFSFLLTHTRWSHENDARAGSIIKPEDLYEKGEVDVVLFGHTHIPEISYNGKFLFINPGHLKSEDMKGYDPSFVILEVSDDNLKIESFKLDK